MKIEIGESLVYSWLRHVKKCQIVQTNWKTSNNWDINASGLLQQMMELFQQEFDNPFGKTKEITSLIKQSEIDALGFDFTKNIIYGVDVSFHTSGLHYPNGNTQTVTKKILRTLLTFNACFGDAYQKEIIFASPKITPKEYNALVERFKEIKKFIEPLQDTEANISLIGNSDFDERILSPLLDMSDNIADTSELFLRSHQLVQLFPNHKKNSTIKKQNTNKQASNNAISNNTMSIAQRLIIPSFRKLFDNGLLNNRDIEELKDLNYCKKTFGIRLPVLTLKDEEYDKARYYKANKWKNIYGEKYLLCNDWFSHHEENFKKWLSKFNI